MNSFLYNMHISPLTWCISFTEIVLPGDPVEETQEESQDTQSKEELPSTELIPDQDNNKKADSQGAEGGGSQIVGGGPSGDVGLDVLPKPEEVTAEKGKCYIWRMFFQWWK